jgi:hypothetical protein
MLARHVLFHLSNSVSPENALYTQKTPKVLKAVWQKPGTEAKYPFLIMTQYHRTQMSQ